MNIGRFTRIGLPLATACLVALCSGGSAVAQVRVLDEGVFDILISGRPAGSEEFSIRRSGSDGNPQIVATAEITISEPGGDLYLRPALQVIGREMRVTAYQQKISGTRVEDIFVTAEDDRFFSRSRTTAGEREREFRAPSGSLILDPRVAHHYYFPANMPLAVGSTVPVVVPMDGRQEALRFSEVGTESIEVGGVSVSARRLLLGEQGTGVSFWVDEEGRVMRVDDPSASYSAIRREVPSSAQ